MKKQKFFGVEGVVYALPVGKDHFGYFLYQDDLFGYCLLFNFLSLKLTQKKTLFKESTWLRPFRLFNSVNTCSLPIFKLDVALEKLPPMVDISIKTMPTGQARIVRFLTTPTERIEEIDNKEAGNYWGCLDCVDGDKQIISYINSNRNLFRVINGEGAPPPDESLFVNEEEQVEEIDLELLIKNEIVRVTSDDLIPEIEKILEEADISGVEMIDGSDGEVVVRLPKSEGKKAVSVITKFLRNRFTAAQISSGMEFTWYEVNKDAKELEILPRPRKRGQV